MHFYSFHISFFDGALLVMAVAGLTIALLNWFTKSTQQSINRWLAGLLGISVIWMLLPVSIVLAIGPMIFMYVRKTIQPAIVFAKKDLFHFSPLLLGLLIQALSLYVWNGTIALLVFLSLGIYLLLSCRLIMRFYKHLPFRDNDRNRYQWRWLQNDLVLLSIIGCCWAGIAVIDFLYYQEQMSSDAYYIMYLLSGAVFIRMGARALLNPQGIDNVDGKSAIKPTIPFELKQKASWLKQEVKLKQYYQDPELTLQSLASLIGWPPHELSRVINTGIKKNFADFINAYRVAEVIEEMQEPSCDHITLLGLAWGAGFNAKSSFNRVFKEMTGRTPLEYKNALKKGVPDYKMGRRTYAGPVFSAAKTSSMFKNYWKTAWRNLAKNKFYSAINIAGLALGLTVGILVLLWVQDELGYDGYYKKAKDIYRVELWGGTGNNRQIFTIGVAPIGPFAKQQLPAVQDYARLTGNNDYSLYKYKDKVFGDERAIYADPSLFALFDIPLLKGNSARPFTTDNSVVMTETLATKFFGNEDPIGKIILGDNKSPLVVSGVMAEMPKNSSLQYDMIMPISNHFKEMRAQGSDMSNNFGYLNYITYLRLKPGSDLRKLEKQITTVHLAHSPDDTDADYLLLPISKMHLYNADGSDKGIGTVRIFIAIALLILVIACINYTNLSTARSMLRAKEISMRKIIGAGKTQLFGQFIMETALLFLIAALLAIGGIFLLMPVFNTISGKEMRFDLTDYHVWALLLTSITGTLAASSIYPALLLSSFEPLKALKGKITARVGDVLFRKILVVTQFAFSIILMVGTIIITRQLNFIRAKGVGYDKTHVLTFWMRDMNKHYDAVKAELLKQPGITAVTRSNQNIVHFQGFVGNVDWDGKDPKQNIIMHPIVVDRDLLSFFNMQLVAGTSFTGGQIDTAHYILNEAAIKEMGIKEPIGKRFRMQGTTGTIIGVVKDFHYSSMKEKIAPSIFWFAPQYLSTIYIKTTATGAQTAIAAASKQFKQYNAEYPFGYAFLDDIFDNLYKSEQREGTLFTWFAAIAIFISCLGLLGLTAYTAQVRTREIGVRKVLGASVGSIIRLLAKDFIQLVCIAMLMAAPVAWYAMHRWLSDFAYRIAIGWQVFAIAGTMALLIAFITISLQAVKAAVANPVKTLRSE
ncbi:MAG: ABC transporter permease [Chitinophagaceae bacterium]